MKLKIIILSMFFIYSLNVNASLTNALNQLNIQILTEIGKDNPKLINLIKSINNDLQLCKKHSNAMSQNISTVKRINSNARNQKNLSQQLTMQLDELESCNNELAILLTNNIFENMKELIKHRQNVVSKTNHTLQLYNDVSNCLAQR